MTKVRVRTIEFDVPLPLAHVVAGTTQFLQNAPSYVKVVEEADLPDGKKITIHVKPSFHNPAESVYEVEITATAGGTHFWADIAFFWSVIRPLWAQAQGIFQDLSRFLGYQQLIQYDADEDDEKRIII